MSRGLWYAVAAYLLWGSFPVYFRLFRHVPAMEVLGHRIVWSFVVLAAVAAAWRRRRPIGSAITVRVVALYGTAAVFIGVNWFIYVWAVNSGYVVETSLGYFITPLVNVIMGVLIFRERLRPAQSAAVVLAACGVVYLTVVYGSVPWIAFGLAVSFGTYGLIKKTAPLDALRGLTFETGVLFLPAVLYLVSVHSRGEAAFLHTGTSADLLLAASGPVTIVPLLLFGAAVRRVPLSVVGILQYIAPSIQFVLGVFLFHEPFSSAKLIGFAIVWAALAIFAADGLHARRQQRAQEALVMNQ